MLSALILESGTHISTISEKGLVFMKKREVLITTKANEKMWSVRLYTDYTYEVLNTDGNILWENEWLEKDGLIYHLTGDKQFVTWVNDNKNSDDYGDLVPCSLNDLIPDLKDLIALEQLEKSLFGK